MEIDDEGWWGWETVMTDRERERERLSCKAVLYSYGSLHRDKTQLILFV